MELQAKPKPQPHAVCLPLPFQGHINAMLHLARVLHFKGFFITFVNSEFNHKRILNSRGVSALNGLTDFRFATIPDGLPSPDNLKKSHSAALLCASIQVNCLAPFKQLLTTLNDPSSRSPPVTCVVSDAFTSFTLDATQEMRIPNIFFCSVSTCAFMGLFYYKELMDRGIIPLKCEEDISNGYLDTIIDWIPGLINMRLKDLPTLLQTTNPRDILLNFVIDQLGAQHKATTIIFNTFNELEGPVLDALATMLPPFYDIGPVCLLSKYILGASATSIGELNLWKEDSVCMKWLDEKEPNFVLYVNFGSITMLKTEQLTEFAWGLSNSGYKFMWIIRPDLLEGETALLPPEFLAETKKRSLITSWCPQEQVLCHPAIGGFLTHCGWNSTMESISAGVPLLCWPFFADQQTNCRYSCSEWGIGLEIEEVKRGTVEMLIKEVLHGEKGNVMKRKIMDWKEKAHQVARPGGDSWKKSESLIEEIMIA